MAMFTMSGRRVDIQVVTEPIDVTSEHETFDPKWRAADSNGHEHYYEYEHGYPTLRYVVDASHWCDGTEGYQRHEPHEQIDEAHYECLICGEHVEPGTLPPYTPQWIPGTISATATATLDDGRNVTVVLSRDEVDRARFAIGAEDQDEQLLAIVESVPPERVLEMKWRFR